MDSCCVVDGIWGYGTSTLNHYFHGDLEILFDGLWSDSTCRLRFVGAEEQWLKNHMFWDLKIWDLYVDQPVGDPDSKLMVAGDIKCKNWTYIPEGRMEMHEGTLIVDERIQINTGGKLSGLPGTTIQMADNSHIFPNGGDIVMSGTEANPCTITNQGSGYYNFNIVNGGYFEATWTTVEYPVTSGVHFYNGGIADTNTGFQHCTFQNGATGGTLLQFSTDQEVEFYNVQFPDTPLSGNYNATKLNDAGNISFLPAYGTFAGENYENDPFSRITWDLGIEWTGAVSSDWHTAGNWVNDMIPTSNTDVLIPDGTPNDPIIGTDHAVTNSLFLESNTTLTLSSSYDIILYENAEIWGTIAFSGNEDFTTQGDLIFRTGSSVSASSTCDIKIYGDMIIEAGSNVDITGGYTEFQGSDTSRLICLEDSAAVWSLRINKSGGAPFYFDASSAGDFFINSFFYNMSGNVIYGDSPEKVYLNRSYINNGGNLYSDHTHFIFSGNAGIMPCKMSPGDYYNDLTIRSTSHLDVDLTYSDTLHIKGDLVLASNPSGSSGIDANGAYMLLEGNWINYVGSSAFVHGENTVEFYNDEDPLSIEGEHIFYGLIDNTEGSSSLTIYEYNEVDRDFDIRHFVTLTDELYVNYTLRLQDPTANLVLSSGSYTEVYSLTQGGTITCNNGFFSVSDIQDDYLIGTYIINGGYVEILQDASDGVDLGADITITDGSLDIYGGSSISKWPAQVNGTHPTLTMSGGQLYIASQGIEIETNSPNYTITENITGGKIRTNGHFYCRGVDTQFSPSGGEVEITGNQNTSCEVYDTGNTLWSLKANKSPGYTVKNTHELNITNSLIISRGEFHDMGNPVFLGS